MENKTAAGMLPVGPLMIEHRLIERAVSLLQRELADIRQKNQTDSNFIHSIVDFFTVYADRCHHGKEEKILFKELEAKPLTQAHKAMLEDLIQDHILGRKLVDKLSTANDAYSRSSGAEKLKPIAEAIENLVNLYKEHIRKEDKQFFIPVMKYLSQSEQAAMLCKFREFDRNLIHEGYKNIVSQLEAR